MNKKNTHKQTNKQTRNKEGGSHINKRKKE